MRRERRKGQQNTTVNAPGKEKSTKLCGSNGISIKDDRIENRSL